MPSLTLERANTIIAGAFAKAEELKMKPLAVCVLDAGGHVKAFQRQDGASMLRFEIGSRQGLWRACGRHRLALAEQPGKGSPAFSGRTFGRIGRQDRACTGRRSDQGCRR